MPRSPIRELIDRFNDDEAMAQLQALGEQVVPTLHEAYAALESYDWITAQWLNRILAVTAADPVGTALHFLGQELNDRIRLELVWILRRFVQPSDRTRLLKALKKATPVADDPNSWPPNAAAAAVLAEGMGLAGQPKDLPILHSLLETAQGVLKRYGRDSFSSSLLAEDYFPLAAAAAAGLLAISERASLPNARERVPWRRAAVQAALGRDHHWNSAMNVPMPFFFAHAPREAALVLEQVARKAREVDPLISDLRYWLLIGREIGLQAMVASDHGALPWLDELAARADPNSYGPGAALEIRSFLQPAQAMEQVLERLSEPWLSRGHIAHGARILHDISPFAETAAIAVEAYFVAASGSKEGLADVDDENREVLRRNLLKASLPAPKGWRWAAPPGQPAGVATPQALHAALCAVAHQCAAAASAPSAVAAQEALAPLAPFLSHALVRHAYFRNLLLAVVRPQEATRPALWAALESLAGEKDPFMAYAIITMARAILKKRAGPLYLALLRAPALQDDLGVADVLVQLLPGAPTPDTGAALLAFARQIEWGEKRGDYGVDAAITEAMGLLGVFAAIPPLLKLVGHSTLGSNAEVALLRLASRDPHALSAPDFRRAFEQAMEDGFSEYGLDLLGEQLRAEIVQVLEKEHLETPILAYVCRFLYLLHGQGALPPQALPLLLARLPQAIAGAKEHPGEVWEDRNWGGYNATTEETLADWLSSAIKSVADGHYSRAGWRTLIGGLLRLDGLDLAHVELAESSGYSYEYREYDLYAVLSAGLDRVEEGLGKGRTLREVYESLGTGQNP